jgi:hypothetical protein
MKILPNRTMRLGGKRVEAGKVIDVPQADGDLAVRHGWAVPAPGKPEKATTTTAAGDGKDASKVAAE